MGRHPREVVEYDWESLDEGETIRTTCSSNTCTDKIGKALTITRTAEGCIYNCYRCGLPDSPGIIGITSTPNAARSRIADIRAGRKKLVKDDPNYKVQLPKDFTNMIHPNATQIPPQAKAWIFRCELDEDDIYTYNIGWSQKLERVIIPIYDGNTLIAWQGRDIWYDKNMNFWDLSVKGLPNTPRQPLKYYTEYNNNKKRNKLYFKIKKNKIVKQNKNLIIVEDILSCIKVFNKFGYHSVALLNSTIHDTIIRDLNLNTYNNVYLWLDPDKNIYSIKQSYKLRILGINCHSIRTTIDPKLVPYREMEL